MIVGPTGRRAGRLVAVAASAAAALAAAGCGDGDAAGPAPSQLVWADEFDGSAGQPPDPSRWTFDIGTDWGNRQLEFDTDRAENVSLDGNGHLAITARRESFRGSPFTSGRIKTLGRFEHRFGRFEARIDLPSGRGVWPAFWLLGADFPTVGWPQCGEIDVMEFRGQEPSVIHGSLHGPGYSGGGAVTSSYTLDNARFDTDFHVYAVEWTSDGIKWFVDDVLYQSVRRDETPGAWVFDHPFFVLLNVAVGGNFVGSPAPDTTFPQTMLVDWVRVYDLDAP